MQLIELETAARENQRDPGAHRMLSALISNIGDEAFARSGLALLNRWIPICWWSVYRLFDDAPPTVHLLASQDWVDGTRDAWRVYRAGLYRRDDSFASAHEHVRRGHSVMTHLHACEMRPAHRRPIYGRFGLRERVSLVSPHGANGLLAINLYRNEEQRVFSDREFAALSRFGPPLIASVARHLELAESRPRAYACGQGSALASLSGREHEVCERLLRGWTHDGIATDLGLSVATVKTYRNRAFERLGIHHRNQLFALARAR